MMTRQMSAGSQIAFTKAWLERQGIEAQTIDVEAHIDPSLSYEENIKLMKRQFKLGGGRSRQKATRDLSAAECDVAIGNYRGGYNHGSMKDACACGHPDACVDLERAVREAAAKPKATKRKKRSAQQTMSGKTKPQKKPKKPKKPKKCVRVKVQSHTRKCPTR